MKSRSKDVDNLFLILTIVFSLFVRIFPILRSNFPLVDGGMFFSMIEDLQAANYFLPNFMSYNHQQIFYAYQPFALYFTGVVNSFTGIPLLKLIQWQPVVINVLTLAVVYCFAKRITGTSTKGLLATFIFSFTPNAYIWQIVGGGLTRSFGALFAFLFSHFAYRIFHDKDESVFGLLGAILSGALVVLSHPEWALQAVFSGFLFFVLWGRDRLCVRKSALIVLAILALTSFWWITMIQRFGIQTFLNASFATDNRLLFFLPFFSLQYTGESITFIAVFGLIGAFVAIAQRKYFLLIWGLGSFLVDPRGGYPFSLMPFSILAMLSITELIAPFILKSMNSEENPWWNFLDLPVGKLFFGFFAVFCISNAFQSSNKVSEQFLSIEERQAIIWVKVNSGHDDKFLVLGSQVNPIHSSLIEWFPALADRQSITTVQGQEWFNKYHSAIDIFSQYQQCLEEDILCIQEINKKSGLQENCIFISFQNPYQKPENNSLYLSLIRSSKYSQVFSSSVVKIFCQKE